MQKETVKRISDKTAKPKTPAAGHFPAIEPVRRVS